MRKLLKALLILLAVLLAVVIIYVGYVMLSYDRIPDNQELEIRNPQETDLAVRLGEEAEAPLLEPATTLFLGTALLHAGRPVEARAMLQRAVDSANRIGFAVFQTSRLARLGAAMYGCGDAAGGEAAIAEAGAMAARQGEKAEY